MESRLLLVRKFDNLCSDASQVAMDLTALVTSSHPVNLNIAIGSL